MLDVALVGFGLSGRAFHAPFLASTPGLRLAAVVTGNADRAEQVRSDHPQAEVIANRDELWSRADEFDLAVVATPNRDHVACASAALTAGLATVVDKPLAPTAADAQGLVILAREQDRLLTVFQNRRWDGDFLTLRALVRDGRLGTVQRLESRFERWRPLVKQGWKESPDPADAGGALVDLGSHLIDQAVVLLGPVRHVYAEVDVRRAEAAVDDDAFVALRHEGGAVSHLWMSAVAALRGPRLRVLGDRAAYVKHGMDVQEQALRSGAHPDGDDWGREPESAWGVLGADDEQEPVATLAGDYGGFYRGVRDALRDGAPPPVDPADAVRTLELIEAARRAAAQGTAVAGGG